jgi:hypothetical protein
MRRCVETVVSCANIGLESGGQRECCKLTLLVPEPSNEGSLTIEVAAWRD